MLDRRIAPVQCELNALSLAAPVVRTLDNGIDVYQFINPDLDLIHFNIRIKAGSLFETQKCVATAAFALLIESAEGRTSSEVEDFLDYYGVVFNTQVNLEYATISLIIPKSNCETVLPFIYSFIAKPVYKEENLLLYKQRKIKELQYNMLKVGFRSGQLMFNALLNPALTAGESLTEQHIEDLSIESLSAYHQKSFCANNMQIFVTGNITDSLLDEVTTVFGQVPVASAAVLPFLFSESLPEKLIFEKREDSMQSSLLICRKGLGYHEEERRNFSVLATLFGGYFGSRLMQNLREKNGYTYGVHCFTSYFGESSIFYIDTDVNVEKTQDALRQCQIEMERLRNEWVSSDELNAVKSYMKGALLRKLDGSVSYMKEYILWNSSGLDEKEPDLLMKTIDKTTPEEIKLLANKYLNPDDYTSIIVGNMPETEL